MHLFTVFFLLMLLLSAGVEIWLAQRQRRHVEAHRPALPGEFIGSIPLESHQKAADYTLARLSLSHYERIYGTFVLLMLTLGGGLSLLDGIWHHFELHPILLGTGFILTLFLITAILELPFSLYRTFRMEQRFGFNRTTPALFVSDMLKQGVLLLLLGAPLVALVLWLMQSAGSLWWLYVWLVWSGFTLLMLWAYPAFIAPLFNRFEPLQDDDLRSRIEALLTRCGFASNGIFVMDGSRRSSHGNAYFSGSGNNKRIVFFDTLLENLNGEEIEAVLAHELGHFRHKHVRSRMIQIMAMSLAGLALLGWLIQQPWFFTALGVTEPSTHAALVLFLLVMPVFTFFTQPLMALSMRKHEFEADDFAAQQASAKDLIQALVKLYKENASTLTPDPLYSAWHDSHPPAPVRIAHLSARLKTE